ncbi:ABC transporter ATP-binding protein [Treponema pedis str. T A4]|uniref:ABC transporter ATP-binding protein n=5 Tax=Treponema pedis TaxID=409322 RepID=S6A846_9SPIR|nr:ABC transporter ATP-binding protein [Treponema pedis str. T A4]
MELNKTDCAEYTDSILNIQNLSFKYTEAEKKTVSGISLAVKAGEVCVITGESGCGKSTLLRCINGLCSEFYSGEKTGSVFLNGTDTCTLRIADISKSAASVFQNPENQFFTLDVLSDMVFPCENFGIASSEIKKRLDNTVRFFSLDTLIGKRFKELSGGEKQKIAVASAVMMGTSVLLMDEPSANLDYRSIDLLKDTIGMLKKRKIAVVLAEHRLFYLKDLCNTLIVMADGSIKAVYDGTALSQFKNEALHRLGLRSISLFEESNEVLPHNTEEDTVRQTESGIPPQNGKEVLFSVRNIFFAYKKEKPVLCNLNLNILSGDKIALIGKNGCGKTTLAKILCGLLKEKSGSVFFHGKKLGTKQRYTIVSCVMQNVDLQIFGSSVYEDLLWGNEMRSGIREKIPAVLKQLNLFQAAESHPQTLSAGQKQRLIIASSYILNKPIHLFDEPTAGLDYKNMQNVCSIIDKCTDNGGAAVIITHDYEFIINTCNRAVLLKDGQIAEDFPLNRTGIKKLTTVFTYHL